MTNDLNAKHEKKRSAVPWVATVTALVILCAGLSAGIVGISGAKGRANAELDNIYTRALYDTAGSLNEIESDLSKLMVTSSPEAAAVLASNINRNCAFAASSIAQLKNETGDTPDALHFLNRLGDFCASYSKRLIEGEDCCGFEDGTEQLYADVRSINNSIQSLIADGGGAALTRTAMLSPDNAMLFRSSARSKLNYDGKFSDSLTPCFKALEDKEETDAQGAAAMLKKTFPEISDIKMIGQSSNPDGFEFTAQTGNGNAFFAVSKKGCMLLSAIMPQSAYGTVVKNADVKQAALKATEWAEKLGYKNTEVVRQSNIYGVYYAELAPVVDDVIYYTDAVKVRLDGNLSLLGFEASGYCRNNCVRKHEIKFTEAQAREKLSARLNVISCRKAVIADGNGECLAYEFKCEYKGVEYYVYIGAQCSKQKQIYRISEGMWGKIPA